MTRSLRIAGSLLLVIACDRRGARYNPQRLLEDLRSFQSPQEAQNVLDSRLLPWRVVEDTRREGVALLIVSVRGFEHRRFRGDLVLTFLDNRLMEARFHPPKLDEYLQELDRAGVKVSKAGATREERVTVFTDRDEMGAYVAWIDVSLEEEYVAFIKRAS